MFEKLENMRKRFYELNGLIADPAVMQRREEWQNLVKEHAALEPVVESYERYLKAKAEMENCREMMHGDKEMAELAEAEYYELRGETEKLTEELKILTKTSLSRYAAAREARKRAFLRETL